MILMTNDENSIRQIKLQARLKERKINSLREENYSLKEQIKSLSQIAERLEQDEIVPMEEIKRAGFSNVSEKAYSSAIAQTALRNRLYGLGKQKQANLEYNTKELATLEESLRLLERCQKCNGEGITVTRKYQRGEEAGIQVAEETLVCSFCGGTGKISLKD